AELKEQETHDRAAQRQADEALAQVTARRDALAELERQRVGLAPAAQALLRDKAHFGDVILGPLSDFVRTNRRDAQLAEQLLGEWLHAVLVRDDAAVEAVRQWHQRTEPGPLVLLPCAPGPRRATAATALQRTLNGLATAEAEFAAAGATAEQARAQELEAGALKGDAERAAAHTQREAADATTQVERLSGRLAEVETRLATLR